MSKEDTKHGRVNQMTEACDMTRAEAEELLCKRGSGATWICATFPTRQLGILRGRSNDLPGVRENGASAMDISSCLSQDLRWV